MVQAAPLAPSFVPEVQEHVCAHHWVIQPADGPMSNGTCQSCGATKDFKNYVETATWGDTRLTNRTPAFVASDFLGGDDDQFDDE